MAWLHFGPHRPQGTVRHFEACRRLLFLISLLALLVAQTTAWSQDITFDYVQSQTDFTPLQQFNYNGDATTHYGSVTGMIVVPTADPNVPRYGSVYYKNLVDVSKGFEAFLDFASCTANGGVSLVIKSPQESRFINYAGQDLGYNGFKNSVAIDFNRNFFGSSYSVRVYRPNSSGVLNLGEQELGHATLNWTAVNGNGSFGIRYSPKTRILDVYFNNRLLLRIDNFHLDDFGTAVDNMVYLGLHATSFVVSPQGSTPYTVVKRWTVGNNLNGFGIGSSYYSDLFPFKTAFPQGIWGPGIGAINWNYALEANYDKSYNKTSSSGGFSGSINAFANNNGKAHGIGLRFEADANGGQANIAYPLYLNMLFPLQQSIPAGDDFTIASNYEADSIVSLNTVTPHAAFRTYFNFNTRTYVNVGVGIPSPFDFLSFNTTLIDFSTTVDDKKIFDTDFLLNNASLFGLIPGLGGLTSIQDNEGVSGPKSSHRGKKGEGTSKGASKGKNPLSYIDLNVNIPNLAVSAGIPYNGVKNKISGYGQDSIIGLHADFTNALLDYIGLGALAALINFDYSFDIGGSEYAFGLHICDLYGDLNLGLRLDHTFQPMPHVRLNFTNLDGGTIYDTHSQPIQPVEFDLNADGSPVDVPKIPMPNQPLVVTPTVWIYNPNSGKKYNTFTTNPRLTIGGDLALNAFQVYAKIGDLVDIDSGFLGVKYAPDPYPIASLGGTKSFQMQGFVPVTGKSFTFLPADSPNPLITSASPNQTLRLTSSNGNTTVTLQGLNFSSNSGVIWDRNLATEADLGQTFNVANNGSSAQFRLPNTLLTSRGVHTMTLINGYNNFNANQRFPSNSVSFTVRQPAPTLASISPNVVTLKTPPVNASNQPILQTQTDSSGNVTARYFVLTANGTNFVNTETLNGTTMPGSVLNWNGQPLETTFVSTTQLTARVPSNLISLAGSADITVTTSEPGGGTSETRLFQAINPAPISGTLSPATSFAGAKSLSLVVNGQNFVPSSKVLFNGEERPTTFVASTRLYAELKDTDLAVAGTAPVQIKTDNLVSAPLTFSVGQSPARTILKFTPTFTRLPGGDIELRLSVKNIGSSDAVNLALATATLNLGTQTTAPLPSSITLPISIGLLEVGQSMDVPGTFRFPAQAGGSGQVRQMNLFGSFSGGPFTLKLRVILP